MKRLVSVVAAVAVLAALVATSALAKGASEAMITGPGLGDGIRLAGERRRRRRPARCSSPRTPASIPSVFATTPNPMRPKRPAGELGPRYTITYTMPGPNGVRRARAGLYPYAKPSPVTYVAPGQRYFGPRATVGGWFVASTALKDELVAVGLP